MQRGTPWVFLIDCVDDIATRRFELRYLVYPAALDPRTGLMRLLPMGRMS